MEAYLTALLKGLPTQPSSTAAPRVVPSSSSTAAVHGHTSSSSPARSSSSSSAHAVQSTAAVARSTAPAPVSPPSSTAAASSQCTLDLYNAVGSFGNSRYRSEDSAPAGSVYTSVVELTSSFSVAGLGIELPRRQRTAGPH